MIRVLIVEDSVTQREIFRRLFANDPELCVVGEAIDGRDAVAKVLELRPDVVLMDIHMPGMDGITATSEIMRQCPVPIVIASATLKKRDVDLAMQAYQAGAVSVIEKRDGAVLLHLDKIAPELRRELIAASQARLSKSIVAVGRKPSMVMDRSAINARDRGVIHDTQTSKNISVLGICASTGGPPVLLEILKALPKPFPIPILLVQHISHGFESGFARWLAEMSGQSVAIASEGQRLAPGVWLAPGRQHLKWGLGHRLHLQHAAERDIHAPSGNPLFESLVPLGPTAAGVLLTGMGDDGATGLLALKQAGGVTLIQSQGSCLIWGMPRAAKELGAADAEQSPAEIATTLTRMVRHG